jgi:hypothetical protein
VQRCTYSPHLTSTSTSPHCHPASLPHCLTASLVRRRELAVASAKPQPRRSWFVLNFVNARSAQLLFFFSSSFAYIRLPLLASHRFPGFCGWPIEPPRLAFDRDLRVRPQSLFLGIPRVSRAFTQPRLCLNPKTFSLPSRDPPGLWSSQLLPSRDPPGLWSSQILRRSLTDLHRTPPTARQPTCRRRWKSLDQDRL